MPRRRTRILLSLLALLLLGGALASYAWIRSSASIVTHHVNGFRFDGPGSLEVPPTWTFRGPGAVGRKAPYFVAHPLTDAGVAMVLGEERAEPMSVAGHPALLARRETFAPGHGGRDHDVLVYVPDLQAGISVYFRTREEDHDAGLAERFDAWRCRRWARAVLASLEPDRKQ